MSSVVREFVLKVIKSKRFGEWYVSQHLLGIYKGAVTGKYARDRTSLQNTVIG